MMQQFGVFLMTDGRRLLVEDCGWVRYEGHLIANFRWRATLS